MTAFYYRYSIRQVQHQINRGAHVREVGAVHIYELEGVGLEGGSRLPSDLQGIEDLANADLSELIELKLWQQVF